MHIKIIDFEMFRCNRRQVMTSLILRIQPLKRHQLVIKTVKMLPKGLTTIPSSLPRPLQANNLMVNMCIKLQFSKSLLLVRYR